MSGEERAGARGYQEPGEGAGAEGRVGEPTTRGDEGACPFAAIRSIIDSPAFTAVPATPSIPEDAEEDAGSDGSLEPAGARMLAEQPAGSTGQRAGKPADNAAGLPGPVPGAFSARHRHVPASLDDFGALEPRLHPMSLLAFPHVRDGEQPPRPASPDRADILLADPPIHVLSSQKEPEEGAGSAGAFRYKPARPISRVESPLDGFQPTHLEDPILELPRAEIQVGNISPVPSGESDVSWGLRASPLGSPRRGGSFGGSSGGRSTTPLLRAGSPDLGSPQLRCPFSAVSRFAQGNSKIESALSMQSSFDSDMGSVSGGSNADEDGPHPGRGGRRSSVSSSSGVSSKRSTRRRSIYSQWESHNYGPVVRMSWVKILPRQYTDLTLSRLQDLYSLEHISTTFYDAYLELCPSGASTLSDKSTAANHFLATLNLIVESAEEPDNLPDRLKALAATHIGAGVTLEHIKPFGEALMKTLQILLAKQFTVQTKAAWRWIWTFSAGAFTAALKEATEESTIVCKSWEIANENMSADEIGKVFYDVLFSLAPNLQDTFSKDRAILSIKFAQMLSTLVTFSGDSEHAAEQKKWLGIRHLKYRASHEHIEVMGQTLIQTMCAATGEENWDADTEKAWLELWTATAEEMLQETSQAEMHVPTLQAMWASIEANSTAKHLGYTLRKSLLSGKEWVRIMTSQLQEEADKMKEDGNAKKAKDAKAGKQKEDAVEHKGKNMPMDSSGNSPIKAVFPSPTRPAHDSSQNPSDSASAPCFEEQEAEKDNVSRRSSKDRSVMADAQNLVSALSANTDDAHMTESFKAKRGVPFMSRSTSGKNLHASFKINIGLESRDQANPFDRVASFKRVNSGLQGAPSMGRQNTFGKTAMRQHGRGGIYGRSLAHVDALTRLLQQHSMKGSKLFTNPLASTKKEIEEDMKQLAVSQDAEGIGQKFWSMLSELIEVIDQPEMLSEKVVVMMTFFYGLSVRSEHLEKIGLGLEASFAQILGHTWGQEQHDAWRWFWSLTSTTMEKALQVLDHDDAKLVRNSWEKCKDSATADHLGDTIYAELARLSPRAARLFKRPKSIQALQFVSAIDMMVTFNENPGAFFEQLRPLVTRHIRYGVRADFARAFGKSITRAVKAVLGAGYDEKTQRAWETLWFRVSSYVTRFLTSASGNLLAVALINEDVNKLKGAVDKAPRGDRFNVLTHLNVNGQAFSPFFWALQNSQVAISEFIIRDLLEIRADRQAYYYGRAVLFKEHPNLIGRICKDMPSLLPVLFDGLLWHAQNLTDGQLYVNYYIEEMYGDPTIERDTWKAPLGVLCLDGRPEYFTHPVIEKLLDVKFKQFGLNIHLLMQGWYTSLIILYSIGIVSFGEFCDPIYQAFRAITLAVGCLTVVVLTMLVIRQYNTGSMVSEKVMGVRFRLPRFFANRWNILRFVSCILIIPCTLIEQCDHFEGETPEGFVFPPTVVGLKQVQALTGLFLWVQQIQAILILPKFAALTYTIGCIMPEIFRNMVIIGVLFLSFASAMTCLRIDEYQEGFFGSILQLVQVVLGVADAKDFQLSGWGLVVLLGMIFMVQISLLNILFAQLSSNYQSLLVNQASFAMLKRAYICCEMESVLPFALRLKFFKSLGFDKPLELEQGDTGPSGGIHVAEKPSIRISEKYIPDRVIRFIGETDPELPWPSEEEVEKDKQKEKEKI